PDRARCRAGWPSGGNTGRERSERLPKFAGREDQVRQLSRPRYQLQYASNERTLTLRPYLPHSPSSVVASIRELLAGPCRVFLNGSDNAVGRQPTLNKLALFFAGAISIRKGRLSRRLQPCMLRISDTHGGSYETCCSNGRSSGRTLRLPDPSSIRGGGTHVCYGV